MKAGIIILLILIIIIISMYNNLIRKKNQVANVFASVDALLKKRYDLIPNLVSTVKQYMQHEAGTLLELTELRSKAISGNLNPDQAVEIDNHFSKHIRNIMVAVENYPQLRASENFQHLQKTLAEIEEQISAGRRAYNAAVTEYNNTVQMFPTNIMAYIMRLTPMKLFEITEEERIAPDVNKLFSS